MRVSLSLAILAVGQIVANLATQIILLQLLGPGLATDAYVAAQSIPLLLHAVLAVSLQNVWQPRLATATPSIWPIRLGNALGQAGNLFLLSTIVVAATAPFWTGLLFPGFGHQQRAETAQLIQIMSIGALFNGAAAVLVTSGRCINRFIVVDLVPLIVIGAAVAALPLVVPRFGTIGAAWLFSLRSILAFAILWLLMKTPRPRLGRSEDKHEALQHLLPLIGGASFYKLGPLVDRFWSSQSAAGSMTFYTLVQSGLGAAAVVLDRTFSTTVTPDLARRWAEGDRAAFARLYRRAVLRIWLCVALGGATVLLLYSTSVAAIELLFKASASQAEQVFYLALALLGYLGVAAAGNIVVAAFYAMGDTRTPVRIGAYGFVAGVALKSAAFAVYGLLGMAVATSVYYLANFIATLLILERRVDA